MKEEGDLVTEGQLDRVHAALRQVFLMNLALAAAAGITFSAVVVLVGYAWDSDLESFAPIALLAGAIVAVLVAKGHWMTYGSELKMVAELRRRVRQGELVYANSFSLPKKA
jgi:hypothetical protein